MKTVNRDEKFHEMLVKIRQACEVLWTNEDFDNWHVLFDAHNEAILSNRHPTKSEIDLAKRLVSKN